MASETEGGHPRSDKPRISLVLTGGQEQRDRWEEHRKEHWGSLAEMVRTLVEQDISGKDERNVERSTAELESEQVGEVLNLCRQMQASLESLDNRVSTLETGDTSGEVDLERTVLAVLPETPDAPSPQVPEFATTSDEIARKLGASREDINDTLASLEAKMGTVESKTLAGPDGQDTYYWVGR